MIEVNVINPLTGLVSTVSSNQTEQIDAVDFQGAYLGKVAKSANVVQVPSPPSTSNLKWDFLTNTWVRNYSIIDVALIAKNDIDNIAGATRLRYITDVPGQQATYLVKKQQADTYLLDNSIVGPYLAVEAAIMNTSVLTTAQQIVSTYHSWNNYIGPKIEGIRLKAKADIRLATSIPSIDNIRAVAILELSLV